MAAKKERFSLLLLEPGEIYFEDYAVFYYPTGLSEMEAMQKKKKGRFKVCSRSVIFDPTDIHFPILKFPLRDCVTIKQWEGSLMSKLDSKGHVIAVECSHYVEMLPGGVIKPYETVKKQEMHKFALIYGTVDDCLQQVCQLHRASTLSSGDQASMIAAIVHSRQSRVKFNPCWLEDLNERIVLEKHGNRITPLVTNPGRILLTSSRIYFQPYNNAETFPVLKVKLNNIKHVVKRRFLLQQVGIELFFSSDSSIPFLFFSLSTKEERDYVFDAIMIQPALQVEQVAQENMTLLWQNGVISNYDYLLYLNSMADRSFNDLAQYPVFPWVIADYTSPILDLSNYNTYRDLNKPVGALTEERLQKLKMRYKDMSEPKFLYGSHYSTPGFVLYYIVRKVPQFMLCLQSGRFDHPDRMFNSVIDTWRNVTTNSSDFKELIPEFYQPENKGDFLTNFMNLDFGTKMDGIKIGDVELPPWAESPEDFVKKMRDALESEVVSSMLHNWIDLIFGYKQQGEEADKADNVFYYLTYEGAINLDDIKELNERHSLEVQIMEFGQVPRQIFNQPHPARSRSINLQYLSLSSQQKDEELEREVETGKFEKWTSMNELQQIHSYQLHKDTVRAVCFSQDQNSLFSVSQDCLLKMYCLEEKKQQRSINISNMALSSMKLMPDGKSALIGSWDNNVYVYNLEYGKITATICAHDDAVSDIYWNNKLLVTSSWDSTVKLWQYTPDVPVKRNLIDKLIVCLDHDTGVNCISMNASNTLLLSGTDDGQVYLWDIEAHTLLSQFSIGSSAVFDVDFSPDGKRFVCCGKDLQMYDVLTRSQLFSKNPKQEIRCLKWDGSTILGGSSEGSLMVWDLMTAQLLKNMSHHNGPVSCMDVSNDSTCVATGGEDKTIVIWQNR